MKILMVSDVFVRHGGGAPNVMFEIGKEIVKQGHEVMVLTFQQKPDWSLSENMSGIEVRRTPLKSGTLPFYFSGFKNMQELARDALNEFHPDVVNVHMPFSGWAALTQTPNNVPVVYTFHASWAEEYLVEAKPLKKLTQIYRLEYLYMRYLEKKALNRADKILTLSNFMQSRAKKYRIEPRFGWEIYPSGVDLFRFKSQESGSKDEFRNKKDISQDAFFILCVRRLTQRMGVGNLVKAIDIVRKEIPTVCLVIGGKGEMEDQLRSQIQENQLEDNVRLEGFISDEELADYYSAADLFVLPTQALEGFGLISLEAMSSGTPVLATPVGANPEVVGAFNGDFVLKGTDPESIARGIISYFKNYHQRGDLEVRRKVREYAEQFSWEKMTSSYLDSYQEVIDKSIIPTK